MWSATDLLLDAPVLVKTVPLGAEDDPLQNREIAALRRLDLPGVARLLDDGVDRVDGERVVVLVLESVPGSSWADLVGPTPWSALRPALLDLLRTLRAVHGAGVIHRDLKPAHVIERAPGEVVLVDFGVAGGLGVAARRLPAGGVVGSLRYAAPEQLSDPEGADARSDLYTVGLLALERLIGRYPWEELDEEALWRARLAGPPPVRALLEGLAPPELIELLGRMLAKARRDRPPDADAALRALGHDARDEIDVHLRGWTGRRWTDRDLAGVFAGPERIYRLRSDAVRALRARAGDEGEALADELSRWIRAGLARWQGGAIAVTREALARLTAAPVTDARSALAGARAAGAAGDLSRAGSLLDEGLRLARAARDTALERALLEERTRVALQLGALRALALGLYELDRAGMPQASLDPLRGLLLAARATRRGEAAEAARWLAAVPEQPDESLDRWRIVLAVELALHREDRDAEATALATARAWVASWGTPTARADLAGWISILAYRAGQMAQAIVAARVAARNKRHGSGRLSAQASLCAALLDAGRLREAADEARTLYAAAWAARHPQHTARAEWARRAAAYRSGQPIRVDMSLVEAASALGGYLSGQVLAGELAIAWRSGALVTARGLARRLGELWATSEDASVRWFARATGLPLDEPSTEQVRAHAAEAVGLRLPGLAVQGLGLLAWARPDLRPELRAVALRELDRVPAALRVGRRELMSVAEALDGDHTLPARAMKA